MKENPNLGLCVFLSFGFVASFEVAQWLGIGAGLNHNQLTCWSRV